MHTNPPGSAADRGATPEAGGLADGDPRGRPLAHARAPAHFGAGARDEHRCADPAGGRGLVEALHSALTHNFCDSFDPVEWRADPEAADQTRRLPLFVGEVMFYAAQEAIRNAARHARGGQADRKLHLSVAVECGPSLRIVIADDGIGRLRPGETAGAGSGLLFHTAMLAVVGGTLGVSERAGGGTQVVIDLRGV